MIFFLALLFLVGISLGSFLSALTWRLPKKKDIIFDRSACDSCGGKIHWYDNIPLLSYLLLGGKCRNCHKRISLRYPIIELVTGAGFVGTWFFVGQRFDFPLLFYLLAFLIFEAIFIIDWEHRIIPDQLIFFLLLLVISYLLFVNYSLFWINLLVGLGTGLFLLLVYLFTRGQGMGLGDVKLAIPLGLLLGWPNSVVWLFASFLTGGIVGIILILARRAKLKSKIAFGPLLVIGAIFALVWGKTFLKFLNLI